MLTARSPKVADNDDTTRGARRSWVRRPNTRRRSSDSANVHSVTMSNTINDDCGNLPRVCVRRSLMPRNARITLRPTTATTSPAPYCGLGRETIGARPAGRSEGPALKLRQADPIECNDQRVRSPGCSVQPLSSASPSEV